MMMMMKFGHLHPVLVSVSERASEPPVVLSLSWPPHPLVLSFSPSSRARPVAVNKALPNGAQTFAKVRSCPTRTAGRKAGNSFARFRARTILAIVVAIVGRIPVAGRLSSAASLLAGSDTPRDPTRLDVSVKQRNRPHAGRPKRAAAGPRPPPETWRTRSKSRPPRSLPPLLLLPLALLAGPSKSKHTGGCYNRRIAIRDSERGIVRSVLKQESGREAARAGAEARETETHREIEETERMRRRRRRRRRRECRQR